MVKTNYTTVIALMISLTALTISITQLVIGLLAMAEGSKRCNKMTMGRWNKRPLSTWHWTAQARFQVLFTTPHIELLAATTNFWPKGEVAFSEYDDRRNGALVAEALR